MKQLFRGIGWTIVCVAMVAMWGGCMRWRFNECKAVGHSTLYCILQPR